MLTVDEFEDFFKSKPVFKRNTRFKSLKFESNLSTKNKQIINNYAKPSLIEPSYRKTNTFIEKTHQNIKRNNFISSKNVKVLLL